MYLRTLVRLSASLLACTIATSAASAEEEVSSKVTTKTTHDKRAFLGLSGGAGYAWVTHPLINANSFAVGAIGLHAGYHVSEHWAIGGEMLTVDHSMSRNSGADPFTPTGFLSPQAQCDKCAD